MGGDIVRNNRQSRMGLRHTGGEIVEVEGGHIVRSIGRKDRHSKVCTAKGPRDRRVRLSAHTAIQFYDVQDRLGYDRPSKAVDWLIKKAKASIDQLAELPAWNPMAIKRAEEQSAMADDLLSQDHTGEFQTNSSFLPPSLDSDSIADTIKSFFPTGASSEPHSQDLRLSLQSFQDPILHHHHNHQPPSSQHQNLFTGAHLGFDPTSTTPWSDQQNPSDISRFQRLITWNTAAGYPSGSNGGFVINPPPPPPAAAPPMLQPLFGQNQFISQRGPLQSSNTQSIRAWIDPFTAADHHHHHHLHQSPFSTIGYTSNTGFTGFHIPARIQGDEEEHDGISDKPSSASSDSRH